MSVGGHIEKQRDLKNRVSDRHDDMCRTDRRGNDGPSHVSIGGNIGKVKDP